jgi:peptidoglycan/xylan/chitin deacetylase (PgdA/CDA1 family)
MYHYIRNFKKKYPFFKTYLKKDHFVKQLNLFEKDLGIFKNFSEFENNKNKYLLTFDDGLKEQIFAAKELAKRKMMGIFFIATMPLIERKFLDVHKIHLLIGKVGSKKLLKYLEGDKLYQKNISELKLKNTKKFIKAYSFNSDNSANIILKKNMNYLLDKNIRSKILNKMMKKFNINEKVDNFYMNKSDINHLLKLGMIVGSHGHSHQLFSKMNATEQKDEIFKSKLYLEKITNNKINLFCYPYGRKYTYKKDTIKFLKQKKIDYAFAVNSQKANLNDLKQRFELPRFDTNEF